MKKVCVYCGSSNSVPQEFFDLATNLGAQLARNNFQLIYGGGSFGLMGKVADGALENGGHVTGIIPTFMKELEWAHLGLSLLIETHTMADRKAQFIKHSDAYIVMPGGIGTFEELFETMSLKKLDKAEGPIHILNHNGYYDHLLKFKEVVIENGFMDDSHRSLWHVHETVDEIISSLKTL